MNPILNTDAYKLTHWLEYPKGLNKIYTYGEARTGGRDQAILYFGLQMVLKDHFMTPITDEMIDEAERYSELTFGTKAYFNRPVWEKVRDLGYYPVRIKSLPEGTLVPEGNVLFTIESTEPWFATTLNALETMLMHVWYPTTIATNDFYIKRFLKGVYEQSGDMANLPWAVNDFGLRGVTSQQAGERGGAAHLVNFRGTDNLAASLAVERIYGLAGRGQSVWATEHSVATSYGEGEGELAYLNGQLDRADDNATLSIVIDSYDTFHFIDQVVADPAIQAKIKARPGRVVFRPDSGNPISTPLSVIDHLALIFGYTVNDKGYKVLNHNVGVIQGDGMNRDSIQELYTELLERKWSADNLVVGSGGGLLQEGFTRDTQRFAVKASYGEFEDGRRINIQKKPKTDSSKVSKTGKFKVVMTDSGHITTVHDTDPGEDLLQLVYDNGQLVEEAFGNIVTRAEHAL